MSQSFGLPRPVPTVFLGRTPDAVHSTSEGSLILDEEREWGGFSLKGLALKEEECSGTGKGLGDKQRQVQISYLLTKSIT